MGNRNNTFEAEHPPQWQFLPFVDGELAPKEATAFAPHLEACWSCRLRIGRIEESVASFMEFDEALSEVRFPSDGVRTNFRSRLGTLADGRRPKTGLWTSLREATRFWTFSTRTLVPASVAALLIVAILYQFVLTPTVSASELLEKASAARRQELRSVATPVTYQKLKVSERDRSAVFEVWSDVENSRAKRAVDGPTDVMLDYQAAMTRNGLNALDPLSPELYRSWSATQTERRESVDDSTLPGGGEALALKTVVDGQRAMGEIVSAALVVRANDWHPVSQAIEIKGDDENRTFAISQIEFKVVSRETLAANFFDDSVPQIRAAVPSVSPQIVTSPGQSPEADSSLKNSNVGQPLSAQATTTLEVELIDLLNNAGAFTGEQIDVSRTADGKLQVKALVETDKRKNELLAALMSVKNNPAVRVDIETVAEAQAREQRSKKNSPQTQSTVTVDQLAATESPVFNELRKRLSEAEVQAFAALMIRRSIQARDHATALRKLSERFSTTELASLSAADRTRWLGLLRGHAAKFLAANESLQKELQTVFPDVGGGGGSRAVGTDREIQAAIRELYGLAVACDEDVRASFASFTNAGASDEVKTAKFWRAINTASALARSIQSAR